MDFSVHVLGESYMLVWYWKYVNVRVICWCGTENMLMQECREHASVEVLTVYEGD